jgi:hypothetical protein
MALLTITNSKDKTDILRKIEFITPILNQLKFTPDIYNIMIWIKWMTVCYIEKMKKNNKEHYCHRFLIKHLILSLVLNVILSSMTSLFILAVGYCLRKRYQSLPNFITLISFELSLQTSGNRTHNFCGDN